MTPTREAQELLTELESKLDWEQKRGHYEFTKKGRAKLVARFGGQEMTGEDVYHIGETILSEGVGGGYYCIPWALDEYEKALDLSPAESWLLRRFVKHAWQSDTLVYPSLSKIERQTKIGRRELDKICASLEAKGFIKRVCHGPVGGQQHVTRAEALDRRIRWDISNAWRALWCCIVANPLSRVCEGGIGWNVASAKEYAKSKGFVLNWGALFEDPKRIERKRRKAHEKAEREAEAAANFHYPSGDDD